MFIFQAFGWLSSVPPSRIAPRLGHDAFLPPQHIPSNSLLADRPIICRYARTVFWVTGQTINRAETYSETVYFKLTVSSLEPIIFFFTIVQQPPVVQGILIIEESRLHSETPQLVGILWTSNQPVAETSTWQHTTLTTDRRPCPGGIRNHNPSKRASADPRLRPRGHWDRLNILYSL
jgi:hypothetical protein